LADGESSKEYACARGLFSKDDAETQEHCGWTGDGMRHGWSRLIRSFRKLGRRSRFIRFHSRRS